MFLLRVSNLLVCKLFLRGEAARLGNLDSSSAFFFRVWPHWNTIFYSVWKWFSADFSTTVPMMPQKIYAPLVLGRGVKVSLQFSLQQWWCIKSCLRLMVGIFCAVFASDSDSIQNDQTWEYLIFRPCYVQDFALAEKGPARFCPRKTTTKTAGMAPPARFSIPLASDSSTSTPQTLKCP